jgi:DNA-directed RNA polymerase subunit M/transcription elongation factor TFIIS
MFCPECGTLSFPNPKGEIACTNYKCGYNGPANVVIKDQTTGKEVDLSQATSSTESRARVYDVIKDSDKRHGVLTTGTYMCPLKECNSIYVFSYLEQTRSSDEPETRMLTCKDCGKGWREY